MHCNDKQCFPRLAPADLMKLGYRFASMSEDEQWSIFYLVSKNHLRGISTDNIKYYKYKNYLEKLFINHHSMENIIKLTSLLLDNNYKYMEYKILSESNISQIIKKNELLNEDNFIKTLIINLHLFTSGFSPLIFYAFDSWQLPNKFTIHNFRKTLELTIMYIYRALPYKYDLTISKIGLFNSEGGVFDIYLSEDKKTIYKYPKNYAACSFLARQEFDSYTFFVNTAMSKFIFSKLSYDPNKSVISHSFVPGISGDQFLRNSSELNIKQIESLSEFYTIYKEISFARFLDIHPGNFIWSNEYSQWFFIDFGLIPEIGFEYYFHDNFKSYYHNVWQTRMKQIKDKPIRSLDLIIPDM